jgi:hypothetical protein
MCFGRLAKLAVKTCAFRGWPIGQISLQGKLWEEFTMAMGERKSWRELCHAALEAKDPNELLEIVQELNKALKDEEQVRRDFREATRANKSPGRSDINNYQRERDEETFQTEGADTPSVTEW